ncbi:hypothetical protein FH972_005959 [Carpinus fangiana]|uniref:Uncharacterized protein n=1 Tax=Carpinus fangiana TaxID=176857 RepID=A0A5N6QQU1_9ROSI|nr:hypothetical protein FH972_005959 [Carpinus fangiana]
MRRRQRPRRTSAVREGPSKKALTWEGPLGAGIDEVSSPAIGPAVQSLPPMGLCDSDLGILGKAPTVLPAIDGSVGSASYALLVPFGSVAGACAMSEREVKLGQSGKLSTEGRR